MSRKNELSVIDDCKNIHSVLPEVSAHLPKDLDAKTLATAIQSAETSVDEIKRVNNERLSLVIDKDRNLATIRTLVKRVRAAVKGVYGDDSTEYALVGGTRASKRKHSVRTAPKAAKTA